MSITFAYRDPPTPQVPYESMDQYDALVDEATQMHLDMIDTTLLHFKMRWASEAHTEMVLMGHTWLDHSKTALMKMTLNCQEDWCDRMADMLWFTLNQCILATVPFIHKDIPDAVCRQSNTKMFEIPLVRNAAVNTIRTFFDDYCIGLRFDNFDYIYSDSGDEIVGHMPKHNSKKRRLDAKKQK